MKHTLNSQPDFRSSQLTPVSRLSERAGSTLLVVLVVVVMLSLGAYTFSELMIVEIEATNSYGRAIQSRELALSGII